MKRKLAIIFTGLLAFAAAGGTAHADFNYQLLESFPGFFIAGASPDLPTMILAIYKFGIWTVGIAGLLMLVIGGFTYMTSAGNTATAGSAKKIIWDSLLGIVAALGAYLIMYVINPDLTKIDFSRFTAVEVTEGTPMGKVDPSTGTYKKITSGRCTVESLAALNKTSNSSWATQASCICSGESNGIDNASSGTDVCADGTPASLGLFQINITAHSVGGYPCKDAFSGGAYTAKNHSCQLKTDAASQALYKNCVAAAYNPDKNIEAATVIYNQAGSWKPWGARTKCGL